MKDAQGTKRGECNLCKCSKYVAPVEGDKHSCEYCGHRPTDHVWVLDELGQCRTTGSECYKYVGDDPNSFSDCGYCGCHPYSGRLYGAVKEQCQQHQCCVGMNITVALQQSVAFPEGYLPHNYLRFPNCQPTTGGTVEHL